MLGRVMFVLVLGAFVAAALAGSSLAAKPTIDRFEIDETVPDPFLTAECGVPVTVHAEGHVIVRTFGDDGGLVELQTLNIINTVSAGDNTYRIRDVGADQVRIAPDGTAILMIIGQIPFGFTGVLKINLDTEEAILEPQHSLEGRIEDACAALTA
jgi:hypothetical protein